MIEVNYNDYKRILEENMKLIPENHKLKEEIERLNNIINEIEKYAGLGEINWEDKYQDIMLSGKGLLNKIKELQAINKQVEELEWK